MLMFVLDEEELAYHSRPDTWQGSFGYSGFYEEFSHRIVNFTNCAVQDKIADKIVNFIKELMFKMHIMPYDEDKQKSRIFFDRCS